MTELQLQCSVFQWCWNQYPEYRRLLFHVPNGGGRNKIEAGQLKASGVVAGIPDLLFVIKGSLHAFELKTDIGALSPVQHEVHRIWRAQGVTVHIIRDEETFQSIFKTIIKNAQKKQLC